MSNDDSTRIAQVVEKVPWGDIENSVQAIDAWISRLEFVLAAQFKELDSYEGWPAWLDGRVSTEESVDPAGLNYADTLLLSLLALHEHVAGLKPTVPISALCR